MSYRQMLERDEVISGVAIMSPDGTVYSLDAPNRHCNVIWMICDTLGIDCVPGDWEQGFVTDEGTWLRRTQAAVFARMNGQCPQPKWGEELYSEDLW